MTEPHSDTEKTYHAIYHAVEAYTDAPNLVTRHVMAVVTPLLARVSELTAENERLEVELSKVRQERDFVEKKVVEFTESKHKRQRDEALGELAVERAKVAQLEAELAEATKSTLGWREYVMAERDVERARREAVEALIPKYKARGVKRIEALTVYRELTAALAAAVPLEAPKEPKLLKPGDLVHDRITGLYVEQPGVIAPSGPQEGEQG